MGVRERKVDNMANITAEIQRARELEIFNTMPHNTLDEVMEVAQAINDFRGKCERYDESLKVCDSEIRWYKNCIIEEYEQYSTFMRFVTSKVGRLIADFITKKNVTFEEIEKEISETGNPFDIEIIKENEVYGPVDARFSIHSVEIDYFNKWDADEDKKSIFSNLIDSMKKYDGRVQRKEEIERDGIDALWDCKYDPDYGLYWTYNGEDEFDDYDENCGISDESEIEEWMSSRGFNI